MSQTPKRHRLILLLAAALLGAPILATPSVASPALDVPTTAATGAATTTSTCIPGPGYVVFRGANRVEISSVEGVELRDPDGNIVPAGEHMLTAEKPVITLHVYPLHPRSQYCRDYEYDRLFPTIPRVDVVSIPGPPVPIAAGHALIVPYASTPEQWRYFDYFDESGTKLTPGRHHLTRETTVRAVVSEEAAWWYFIDPSIPVEWTFQPSSRFVDVAPVAQFHDEINWLAGQGVSLGWQTGPDRYEYRPVSPIKRDAMAAFLYRISGSPAFTPPTTSPFTDVPTSNLFYKEIAWLAEEGISRGWEHADGTRSFGPLQNVTRDAMAAFLFRSYGMEDWYQPPTAPTFSDVPVSNQFYQEISWLAEYEITTGWSQPDGTKQYRPVDNVNRDAMAAFLFRWKNNHL